ncbi:MAG: single-stranded DNA-binding protein [Bacteroidetes bacterium]|nr:MAG: single-stranded DNA-binding protein [Bacteroidota bacterium]
MNDLRNNVQLIGNLGRDVEFKQLDNGNAIARVTLATKEIHKKMDGNKHVETQWHNLVGWGKVAEIMNVLLKKGKEVAVKGKLTHRSYDDKNGNKRYRSEVVVNEFMLMN